jgi:hypothetical protein
MKIMKGRGKKTNGKKDIETKHKRGRDAGERRRKRNEDWVVRNERRKS